MKPGIATMTLIVAASAVTALAGAMAVWLARSVAPTWSDPAAFSTGAAAVLAVTLPIAAWRLRRGGAGRTPPVNAVQALTALICVAGATLLGIAAWRASQVARNPQAEGRQTAVRQSLVDTGRILARDIQRVTTPSMRRGRKIAADPRIIAALMSGNARELTDACNAAITSSTEIDAVALFDADGGIVAINTRYADGTPVPRDRVDRIMGMTFAGREIIQNCVNNAAQSEALEFQTTCDITPAFFNSSGLSVAHSIPVYGPSGVQLGVVSTRLRFERITELAGVRGFAAGRGTVRFVTDKGGFFDEALNRGEKPPIPSEELARITAPLAHSQSEMMTISRQGVFHALFRMTGLKTIDGGGIQVMLSVSDTWVRREAVTAAALEIGSPAAAGLLLLLVAAVLRSSHLARQRAETAAGATRESQALRSTVDNHSLVSVADPDGRIIEVNERFCQVSGYERGELLGQDYRMLSARTHTEAFWADVHGTLTRGKSWRGEVCNTTKDGSLYWVDTVIAPFTDADGRIAKYVSILTDITDRRRADEKACEAREFLHNVIDSLSAHIVVIDCDGAIRSVNRAWREFAAGNGAGSAVLEGANYLAVCDRAARKSKEAAQVAAAIRAVLAGESTPPAIEYPCHAPTEERWFMCSIRGFALKDHRFAVISHLNTTAIKLAERQLKVANDGLVKAQAEMEERIIQRTAQLSEATVAAQAASKAKSEFLAAMSHEIRTPLNGVVGTLELLQGSSLSEQQNRFVQIGKTSALSLTSVINDILDFSKIEAGKLELSPVEFDLRMTIGDVMEMLAVRASQKGLEMACSIEPALPAMVRGDADRLRQVIINLVNNAIKFTERGTIILRVAGVSDETGGTGDTLATGGNTRVRFSVTDTGIGIPKDRLDRLFKAFSQTDASFSRKYGGTGLGLVICKQLAELMGGGVGVESEAGRGSTFWFEAELPAATAASGTRPATAIEDCRNLRLLVVEDHDVQREFIAECLTSLHFPVETATNGDAALAMMHQAEAAGRPFATVLTDHEMPGMNGMELAAAMRSNAASARIPVILLSSALDLNPARVRTAGFAAHLTKPLRQSSLLDAVMTAAAPRVRAFDRALGMKVAVSADPHVALPPTSSRPRLRVLLAEDNEINQLISCELLRKSGCDCTVAVNGVAAVAAVAQHQYDLVLMDCQMPEMDGFEATRAIRAQEQAGTLAVQKGRRLPIIALTANALKGDRERCLDAGMDAYSTKPIDLKHLMATIQSLMSTEQPARLAA